MAMKRHIDRNTGEVYHTYEERHYCRIMLLRALSDEYRLGDPITKLYVSLLARTIIDDEPELLDSPKTKQRYKISTRTLLERCGVKDYVPNRHKETVKRWHPLTQGKI